METLFILRASGIFRFDHKGGDKFNCTFEPKPMEFYSGVINISPILRYADDSDRENIIGYFAEYAKAVDIKLTYLRNKYLIDIGQGNACISATLKWQEPTMEQKLASALRQNEMLLKEIKDLNKTLESARSRLNEFESKPKYFIQDMDRILPKKFPEYEPVIQSGIHHGCDTDWHVRK